MSLYDVGSPPPEVELEIGDSPPPYQQENYTQSEKEKEAVDGGGLFDPQPPVGVLKNSYVSAKEEEAQAPTGDPKQGKQRGRRGRRKLVPVWRLVS